MNAAGLIFVLNGVSAGLGMPHFQTIVKNGSVSEDEFTGTQKGLANVIATLKKTPVEKIEAMVDKYNDELTAHLDSFDGEWGKDSLAGFRDAQVMLGYVTSVMAQSGLSN
jgi:hypothetical protein